MDKLSRIAWLYIGAVIAAAVIVVARGPFTGLNWGQIGVLGLLLVACESSATLLNGFVCLSSARIPLTIPKQ